MIIYILKKSGSKTYDFVGSGFIITSDGEFVSCGHNFIKYNETTKQNYFCAVPIDDKKSELFHIQELKYQYAIQLEKGEQNPTDRFGKQINPVYKDLAWGKLNGSFSSNLILNRKRPNYYAKLLGIGYRNTLGETLISADDRFIDISKVNILECTFEVKNRELSIFTKIKAFFKWEVSEVPNANKFNNVIMLGKIGECLASNEKADVGVGMSGCPIIDEKGLVLGLFLGREKDYDIIYMLCSKYISKFLRYHTNSKYETYSDLEVRNNL